MVATPAEAPMPIPTPAPAERLGDGQKGSATLVALVEPAPVAPVPGEPAEVMVPIVGIDEGEPETVPVPRRRPILSTDHHSGSSSEAAEDVSCTKPFFGSM